jgi:hypothetical protein
LVEEEKVGQAKPEISLNRRIAFLQIQRARVTLSPR